MGIEVFTDDIVEVLIGNQWHRVDGGSFHVAEYLNVLNGRSTPGAHIPMHPIACEPEKAFEFLEDGYWIYGPISAIQAVKQRN